MLTFSLVVGEICPPYLLLTHYSLLITSEQLNKLVLVQLCTAICQADNKGNNKVKK